MYENLIIIIYYGALTWRLTIKLIKVTLCPKSQTEMDDGRLKAFHNIAY